MTGFKEMYFTMFCVVDKVIEDYNGNPAYEPLIQRLKEIEQKGEEMYVNLSSDEDGCDDDEE